MKSLLKLFVPILLSSCNTILEEKGKSSLSLNEGWTFSQEGKEEVFPATVPGVVHLDLFENQLIDDPYWEDNEWKQRWIENENWVYEKHFKVDEEMLQNDQIEIDFKGLDTYAEVFLNNQKILTTSNMFRSWKKEVKSSLHIGKNHLKVVFQSPILHNREKVRDYPYELPSGNESDEIPIKVSSFTRKAAYQFGWDWSPRFVTSGIWRPIQLVKWNRARIQTAYTTTLSIEPEVAYLQTEVEVEVSKAGMYELRIGDTTYLQPLEVGIHTLVYPFAMQQPTLWWSNGLGEPHLYSQLIQLSYRGNFLDEYPNSFGIRTIELINEPDSIGTSFYFLLNGKPVFMKGANYIPQDAFLPRVKPEQYTSLLKKVKAANMNMLRVWGGGIYEEDLFYDLCDQNGILVWQDFMFAGSLYPDEDEFKENVKQEAIENIKRLRSHPCMAVWCGNNEIEVAWKNWGWQKQYGYSPEDSAQIWNQYRSIFHELIPNMVKEYHPHISYTSTSPLSNWGTKENFNHSSMHYWGVWHGKEPFESFETNVGRFMVEYGFQSFPEWSTLQSVISDSNLTFTSSSIRHRQKSYIGNGLIQQHIEQYYDSPVSFAEFVYLSQEVQAKGMKMAIESHLSQRPHCMGSLFWQLNDCWPGPSWSVIDYYGNKKKAYSVVQEAFATQ